MDNQINDLTYKLMLKSEEILNAKKNIEDSDSNYQKAIIKR